MNRKLLTIAVATAFSLGAHAMAQAKNKMEKCYGISKAGQNACGTATHSCAGQSTKNNDPNEWTFVKKGTCIKQNGTLKPGK